MSTNPILIVEDEADLLTLFKLTLRQHAFTNPILTANGGRAAIQVLHEQTPAVVLLDLAMPQVNGNDVLLYMLSEPRLDQTRVVVVTAVPMRLSDEVAIRVNQTLIKPVGSRELETAVAQALNDFETTSSESHSSDAR